MTITIRPQYAKSNSLRIDKQFSNDCFDSGMEDVRTYRPGYWKIPKT